MEQYTSGPGRPTCATLGHALDRLIEHTTQRVAAGARSAHTLEMQQQHAMWLRHQLAGDLPIVELTSPRLHELAERWLARGGAGGRRLSLSTLSKRLSTLRRALRLAVTRGELAALPVTPEIGAPPFRPRNRVLSRYQDLKRLMAGLPLHRAEYVGVSVWTCQRPGDVVRMTWADVCLTTPETMLVRSTKTRRPHGIRVMMPKPMVALLARRRERLTAEGRPPAPLDPLVDPWPNCSRVLPVVAARMGLPPVSAIDLRHTGFSWMVRRTGITRAAQEWGGWSDFAMLSRHYAHALPPQLADAARELGSIVEEQG